MTLYDKVKFKKNNVTGTGIIVDIAWIDGKEIFTIEDDVEYIGENERYWPLYQCQRHEIELVEPMDKNNMLDEDDTLDEEWTEEELMELKERMRGPLRPRRLTAEEVEQLRQKGII